MGGAQRTSQREAAGGATPSAPHLTSPMGSTEFCADALIFWHLRILGGCKAARRNCRVGGCLKRATIAAGAGDRAATPHRCCVAATSYIACNACSTQHKKSLSRPLVVDNGAPEVPHSATSRAGGSHYQSHWTSRSQTQGGLRCSVLARLSLRRGARATSPWSPPSAAANPATRCAPRRIPRPARLMKHTMCIPPANEAARAPSALCGAPPHSGADFRPTAAPLHLTSPPPPALLPLVQVPLHGVLPEGAPGTPINATREKVAGMADTAARTGLTPAVSEPAKVVPVGHAKVRSRRLSLNAASEYKQGVLFTCTSKLASSPPRSAPR
jgi:hypothetical protein